MSCRILSIAIVVCLAVTERCHGSIMATTTGSVTASAGILPHEGSESATKGFTGAEGVVVKRTGVDYHNGLINEADNFFMKAHASAWGRVWWKESAGGLMVNDWSHARIWSRDTWDGAAVSASSQTSIAVSLDEPAYLRVLIPLANVVTTQIQGATHLGGDLYFTSGNFAISVNSGAGVWVGSNGSTDEDDDEVNATVLWAISDTSDLESFEFDPYESVKLHLEPSTSEGGILALTTLPVGEGFGLTSSVYVAPTSLPEDGEEFSGPLVTGFSFTSATIPLSSLTIPEEANLSSDVSITYGDQTVALHAGDTIDFGPTGITNFSVGGFQSPVMVDDLPALGLEFTAAGDAEIVFNFQAFHPAGDFDGDLDVDIDDYGDWRQEFGSDATTELNADGNRDGVVDGADYVLWTKWKGMMAEAGLRAATATVGVPEPASLMLFAIAIAAMAGHRPRK